MRDLHQARRIKPPSRRYAGPALIVLVSAVASAGIVRFMPRPGPPLETVYVLGPEDEAEIIDPEIAADLQDAEEYEVPVVVPETAIRAMTDAPPTVRAKPPPVPPEPHPFRPVLPTVAAVPLPARRSTPRPIPRRIPERRAPDVPAEPGSAGWSLPSILAPSR